MEITKVSLKKIIDDAENILAVGSALIDDCFVIKNIRLVKKENKYIVAMPSFYKYGKFNDVCNPINQETRDKFNKAIIDEYFKNN